MTATNNELGAFGEQVATDHIVNRGWCILERNWRCRYGELDIVALDGATVVFCEVKTRRSARFGTALEAVTPTKAARLRTLACAWLDTHRRGLTGVGGVRIDVIAVTLRPAGEPDIVHLEAAA